MIIADSVRISSLAKHILNQAKEQFGGYFPLNEKIVLTKYVYIDRRNEFEETKNAFKILKRYLEIKGYSRVQYEERLDPASFKMYFILSFFSYTNEVKRQLSLSL